MHVYPFDFTSLRLIEELINVYDFCTAKMEKYVKVDACDLEDRVYRSHSRDGLSFKYVYE